MRALRLVSRPGFTLTEVIIALTLTAIVGTAATGVLINQSRLFDQQEKLSGARQVSRSATNMLMAELRMVEVGGGVLAASADSVTIRVPYAMGLVCGSNTAATRTVVSLLPVDSAAFAFAAANFSGWARRTGHQVTDGYTYATGTPRSIGPAASVAPCTSASVTTLAGGRTLELQPHVPAALPGVPMFLFQTVTYKFAPSASVPGTRALWRRSVGSGAQPEEVVAPYTNAARFRFYSGAAQVAADAPGALDGLRGIEIVLTAQSERPSSTGVPDRADVTTAVFFRNRLD